VLGAVPLAVVHVHEGALDGVEALNLREEREIGGRGEQRRGEERGCVSVSLRFTSRRFFVAVSWRVGGAEKPAGGAWRALSCSASPRSWLSTRLRSPGRIISTSTLNREPKWYARMQSTCEI
jgi:hypothetical protein